MQISFMAATPRHPLLRRAIDEVVKNVEARYYGPTLTQTRTPTLTLTLTPTLTPTPTLALPLEPRASHLGGQLEPLEA